MSTLEIQHQNLDQKVYETLRTMIVERRLAPGTKIFQDKLAQELGVSRTPLVNDLKKLEHEKLLTAIPRRGFYVRVISKEEVVLIFELREVLEGLAARKAALMISDAQIKKLKRFFKDVKMSADLGDLKKYAEEDRHFHRFLIEIGGKGPLSSILQVYNILASSYQVDRQAGLVRPPQETLQEHLEIIAALSNRDPVAAEKSARQHLANTTKRLREEIAREKQDFLKEQS